MVIESLVKWQKLMNGDAAFIQVKIGHPVKYNSISSSDNKPELIIASVIIIKSSAVSLSITLQDLFSIQLKCW